MVSNLKFPTIFILLTGLLTCAAFHNPFELISERLWHGFKLGGLAELAGARSGSAPFDVAALADEFVAVVEGLERNPVLFIPPLAGVQMELQVEEKVDVPFFLCRRDFPRTNGWINYWMLLPFFVRCFADNMRMECRADGSGCRDSQGVQALPVDSFAAAMTLDPMRWFTVYADLAAALRRLGWEEDKDMQAHVYDTRRSPLDHLAPGGAFDRLKAQVEAMVAAAGKPVVLVAVSTAAPYGSLFLDKAVSDQWRLQHVAALVSISGTWGGVPAVAQGMLSGSWGGLERLIGRAAIKALAQGTPALPWLLPHEEAFGSRALVTNVALGRSYSARQLGVMLHTAELQQAAAVWDALAAAKLPAVRQPRNVSTYCFYGTQQATPVAATYATATFSDTPQLTFSDGDGTVPHESLSLCRQWLDASREGGSKVVVAEFPSFTHAGVLHSRDGLRWVLKAITELRTP